MRLPRVCSVSFPSLRTVQCNATHAVPTEKKDKVGASPEDRPMQNMSAYPVRLGTHSLVKRTEPSKFRDDCRLELVNRTTVASQSAVMRDMAWKAVSHGSRGKSLHGSPHLTQ